MDVYLVRHAIAHERNPTRWPNDALRPLTTAGMRKFRKAAAGLARCVPKTAAIFTSPYVRARETAAMLTEHGKFRAATESTELTPGKRRARFSTCCAHGDATPSCSSGTNRT